MKKLTLFLVAMLFSALSFAALNPYAYGLSSTLDGTTLKVNYSLNSPATGVSVVIMDGETEVKTVTCNDKISKGSHSVEIPTLGLPTGKSLTWKVVVKGTSVNKPTKESTQYSFWGPRGLAIDKDPESEHFGRILVTESYHPVKDLANYESSKKGAGIYVFGPDFTTKGNVENGGLDFTNVLAAKTGFMPWRVKISEDGRIFVSSLDKNGVVVWEVSKDLKTWTPVISGTNNNTDYNIYDADGDFFAGLNVAMDVQGSGENLKLLLYSANKTGIAISQAGYRLDEYALGTATTFTGKPKNIIIGGDFGYVHTDVDFIYDGEGGYWFGGSRGGSDGTPSLVHINSEGVEDLRDETATYYGGGGVLIHKGLLFKGKARSSSSNGKFGIYTIGKKDGKTTLTQKWEVISTGLGRNHNQFAVDFAENLYVIGNSQEKIQAYTLPYSGTVETPCASKYAFELEEVVANVYTLTTNVVGEGTIEGNEGSYIEGTTATLTATPAEHYDFLNWTYDSETSTDNPLTITVNSDMTVTANFQEHTKYTITAQAADNTMGYVTGGGTYYAGETVTLKAVANSTYCFVNWSDGVTDAIRTFTATADVTLTANFAKATPRAWAYDLKMVEDGDNYKFSFNATTAANATLLFLDKEGNELYAPHNMGAVAAGANTVSIEKAYFAQVKDVYWSVKMDGEAITSLAEITDQSRNIYDFYNMQGVVVDNDPNSEKFGEIYIEMAKSGTTNGKAQTLGLFLLNQNLDVLNTNPNVGIQPTMPSGYALNGTNCTFQRLNIHPKTGDLVFSYGISSKPAVFAIDRENMTGSVTNLLDGITGLTKTVAHCFDEDGALYVMDIVSYKGTIYKIKDGVKSTFSAATGKYAADNITMTSDGRGGLWVAQNRGQIDGCYQLAHVNSEGFTDWSIYDDQGDGTSSTGFTGYSTRGALAYDAERQILAQGRNNAVEVFSVAYDATTGAPSLTKIATTPIATAANIDGIAFDYAGDLYVVNSGNEKFNKYTLPTAENICTVPAPESQAIIKEVRYTVTVNAVGNGTATGAGEYVVGETATLEASPAANHQFVNWTYGSETSTDNPLELVVDGDITVTANFAPVQYTLIAPTNDEDKGTVTGAGTYNYGTEVTLTANPATGYKLLYWSDRSTDNPRTITMTKNEAISAYFVKDYAEEPTFTITKVWENAHVPASTTNGYQAVGWDGKIYMQNRTAGKIITYSSAGDTGTDYATSGSGQQIAVDEAGNLIVFNATFSTTNPNAILIYQKGSTEGKAVSFTLKDPAACHFFSASGDIYSAEGGYVYFYCNGKTAINRLKITNGAATAADVTTDLIGGSIYSGGLQNHVMVDIFGNLVTHARSNSVNWINVYTNECKTFTLPSIKFGTLGGCSFELGGKELWAYHAGANNYSSEWNIYNMTDSKFLSDDDFYAVDKNGTTNYACNWLNVQVVDENTAYIYQFCPLKAMAVWKVTLERDDLQKFTVTATTNDPAMGTVIGSDTYYENATATLTATANAGYRFVNWTEAGVEVSTDATYTFTVTEDVELVANFEPLPEITYELNGGVWNKYGWTSKKDMYNALLDDWRAYSGSTRTNVAYETQIGIGNSSKGIPTTITSVDDRVAFWNLFADATYAPKWGWLATYVDAVAATQYKKMDVAQGVKTQPTSAAGVFTFTIGNFFGEDKAHTTDYIDAVDFTGEEAHITAFAPYWGQTFPMPTQPTEEVTLNDPYKEGYLFDGWYANSDCSGAKITVVDETTNGTLYAKWLEHRYTRTVTNGNYGTICLPYGSSSYNGAEFYEIAYLELQADGVTPKGIWLDEVIGALEAGKPYIFKATSTQLIVNYEGDEELNPVAGKAGLTGTFDDIPTTNSILEGNYMIAQNMFWLCGTGCWLDANRAYIHKTTLHDNITPTTALPGRRRVMMGAAGTNQATGIDHLTENGTITPTMEGTYDVLGRKMTEPTATGFYIIDGKKVVIVK